MSNSQTADEKINETYAMFWRLVHLAVHRYGSHPTGDLLVVLSIILLERAGVAPTVSDLAEVTGLPKSSVSRYVSTEINTGFLEEAIDPQDRRRRYLKATAHARKEAKWHAAQLGDAAKQAQKAISGLGSGEGAGADMLALLKQITRETKS
jgi:DNA-binding MarR family transcriptional regulator